MIDEIRARAEAANAELNILYHNAKVGAKTYNIFNAAYDDIPNLLSEVDRLTARAEEAEAERDKAVDDMKTMADCMRESEETTESCCWACKYDPINNDYLGTTECPGYERDDCFEWRGLQEGAV